LIKARALLLVAAHGKVEKDVFTGNEDALFYGRLIKTADLVSDAVLEARVVAGVDGPNAIRSLLRKKAVEFASDFVDFVVGCSLELLLFFLDFLAAAGAFPSGSAPGGTAKQALVENDGTGPTWYPALSKRQWSVYECGLGFVPDLSRFGTFPTGNNRE
jgi:hypothetical protein